MQIYDSVKEWTKAENRSSGVYWKTAIWLGVIFSLGIYGATHFEFRCVSAAVVGMMVWLVFIEKPLSTTVLASGWNSAIHDSLLGHLADDQAIPGWAKKALADALLDGPVTYGFLASLESDLAKDAEQAARSQGDGWRKIATFGGDPRKAKQ